MSNIADMLTGVASSLRTVLTSINDSLSEKDVQEAETLSEVPDQIASRIRRVRRGGMLRKNPLPEVRHNNHSGRSCDPN